MYNCHVCVDLVPWELWFAVSLGVFGRVSGCASQWDCACACLPLSPCVLLRVRMFAPPSVCDCASLCICACPPRVLTYSSPPPSVHSSPAARTWQNLGSWVGPGLELVGGCGKGGKPGRRPLHSSQKQKGHGSPSFRPSDLCVIACSPTHERLLGMLPPCVADPKPEGPAARASYLSAKRGLEGTF